MSSLEQLPDELLLEIFEYLPTSSAWEASTNPNIYSPRYEQHTQRTAQLLNICLTCRKFYDLAEPILYSSLVVQTGAWHTYPRSFCLLSSLLSKSSRARWIQSLENVAESAEPGSREEPTQAKRTRLRCEQAFHCRHIKGWEQDCAVVMGVVKRCWQDKVSTPWEAHLREWPGYVMLALLIALTPNLTNLTLDLGRSRSWLLHVICPINFASPAEHALQGFKKLTRVSIFGDSEDYHACNEDLACRHISSFLHDLPDLTHYHQYGVCRKFLSWNVGVSFDNLVVLKLEACELPINQLGSFVRHCLSLRSFSCELYSSHTMWQREGHSLMSAIASTSHILELLHLTLTHHDAIFEKPPDMMVEHRAFSFADFAKLRSLWVTDFIWFGTKLGKKSPYASRFHPVISRLLPRTLELLVIDIERSSFLVERFALEELAGDMHLLPALKRIEVHSDLSGSSCGSGVGEEEWLSCHYEELGVKFVVYGSHIGSQT